MLTRRSAIVQYQRCPRSRYWLYEHAGTGLEPVKQAIPLVTGTAVHRGAQLLLTGTPADQAATIAIAEYQESCSDRGLDLAELEDASFTYHEQLALSEALIRLLDVRVIPALLAQYEVLEVERQGTIHNFAPGVDLNYRPDALLRSRVDGDLMILSWKTTSTYSPLVEGRYRVDMQNQSEVWCRDNDSPALDGPIRGVQMAFLLKGRRVPRTAAQDAPDGPIIKQSRLDSPLIWGYRDGSFPPKFAASRFYHCTEPHPMRRSKWYPSGMCETPGKLHKLGDDWESFPVWEAMGTRGWIEMLTTGQVAHAETVLDSQWVFPVPIYRNTQTIGNWREQAQFQEGRIAEALRAGIAPSPDVFPQYTHTCEGYFGRRCPCYDLCWGPAEVADAPLMSGLYQIHTDNYANTELED